LTEDARGMTNVFKLLGCGRAGDDLDWSLVAEERVRAEQPPFAVVTS
jgi:hypothetical protein